MKLIYKIGIGVSLTLNAFVFIVSSYGLMTFDSRVQKNRKFLIDTIKLEVEKQIPRSLPRVTGEVYVPNK